MLNMNKYILFIIIFVILTTLSLNYSGGCDILFEFVDSRCIGQMGWPFAYYIFYEVRGEYFDQLKFFFGYSTCRDSICSSCVSSKEDP